MDLVAFRYIAEFSIAKAVPTNSSISYTALSQKTSVDAIQLKRILRYAMTKNAFNELSIGEVAHTPTSLLLLQDAIATINRYSSTSGFPVGASFSDAVRKWGHGSQETTETAFNISKGTKLPAFEYHEENPAFARDFHHVMKLFSKTPPMSVHHIQRGFDWSSLPADATVVDLGGSLGHCSLAILEANPTVKCIVQVLPEIVGHAHKASIAPHHLADRISYQPHSFWDPQPVTNADVYFMRLVFHDWSHKYALRILRALVKGMRTGSRLLIMDSVTLPPGVMPLADEKRVRMRDIQMMIMHNSLERDEGEWRRLIAEADGRLRLVGINTPEGSALSILEIVLDEKAAVPAGDATWLADMVNGNGVNRHGKEVKMEEA